MSKQPDPIRIQLTLGILGFVGVLLGVLATIFGPIIQDRFRQSNMPTQTPIVIVATATAGPVIPTDTVRPGDPTSTPVPPTDTPVPTNTTIAPVAIGDDWQDGCISTLWQPTTNIQPTDKGNGCWREPVHVFSADNGALEFLAERGNGGTDIYGMFAPLPESGSVSLKVSVKELTNVDIWIGVFQQPDITSQGLLLTIPAGNPKKRVIAWKDISSYDTIQSTNPFDQGAGFWFTFNFDALSATGRLNPSAFVTNPVSLPSDQKYLFIGYKGLSGYYRVEGAFFDFKWQ